MLSHDEQEVRRTWFRRHWEQVAFNRLCGITVRRWDRESVELHLPFDERLTAHDGVLHGGVLATLIDTAGCGAVAAGHDFNHGSRITTLSMSLQYLDVARGEDITATAVCTKRGRQTQFAEVVLRSESGKRIAQGMVTILVSGERAGVPG